MDKKLTTAEIVIVVAGAAALIGSFLAWYDVSGFTANAWDEGLFPTYTWVAIAGVLMALAIVLPKFANVDLPSAVLGFTWLQIHLILGFIATLLVVSYLIGPGEEFGIGFWLSLLAGIALLVGAVMLQREPAAAGDPPPLA